jgi:hypothetical protein
MAGVVVAKAAGVVLDRTELLGLLFGGHTRRPVADIGPLVLNLVREDYTNVVAVVALDQMQMMAVFEVVVVEGILL